MSDNDKEASAVFAHSTGVNRGANQQVSITLQIIISQELTSDRTEQLRHA